MANTRIAATVPGNTIREARKATGTTSARLAEISGADHGTVRQAELRTLRPDTAMRLLRALRQDMDKRVAELDAIILSVEKAKSN